LRRPKLLRPEALLSTREVARGLGVCVATVHKIINEGKLRSDLFGAARRVRAEDVDAYKRQREPTNRPPARTGWQSAKWCAKPA